MKKIFGILLNVVLLISLLKSEATYAASCTVTTNPSPVTTSNTTINLTITSKGLVPDKEYAARLSSRPGLIFDAKGGNPINGKIIFLKENNGFLKGDPGPSSITNMNPIGVVNPGPSQDKMTFEAQTYTLSVIDYDSSQSVCSDTFTVAESNFGGTCGIGFTNKSFTTKDDIAIKATNLGGNPGDGRKVQIKKEKANGLDYRFYNTQVGTLSSNLNLGKFEEGVYYLEIRSGQDFLANRDCYTSFAVGEKGGFGPSPGPIATPPPLCKGGFCETALGKIFTDPTNFVKSFFGILLSLAGGIALILIIISGYRLMASGGNPEKVQAAREQLTSAIVGLLFIIFSLSILQIIGVDILHIPGLTK